ncbi:MAG TPA: phospholipase D-like domain-containing protein [Candidatus Methylomirabilis sp.]|nr:phospholipase D-like domain-containing protein [Candidatus Methylomirabilis sp.]
MSRRLAIALAPALVLRAVAGATGSHAPHPEPASYSCPVAVRFSPHGGAEQEVIATLRRARVSVHAAVFGLTNRAIEAALKDLAQAGVRVAVKADRSQSAGREQSAVLDRLRTAGVVVEIPRFRWLLHDKFAVVDRRWVITGSFNWTTSAERRNRENVLILDCPSLADLFEAEWESIASSRG